MPRFNITTPAPVQITTGAVSKVRVQNIGQWPVELMVSTAGAPASWDDALVIYSKGMLTAENLISAYWPAFATGIIWARLRTYDTVLLVAQ